ncbi:MAG: HDIG domain-containing protein [Bacteroidales bacterium]|nr:HDIG domain-containing protein [Bacteroidales bacterium]
MKKIYRFLKLHFQDIIRGLLFLVAIVAILVFLPRERKFKYEFQKGKAWMHEDLIAPFDFPIYKTDSEIIAERNAILSNVKPIFRLDSAVLIRVLPRFKTEVSDLFENQNKERKNTAQIPEPIMAELQKQLSFVYKKGIISNGEYFDISGKQTNSISILTGNRAFETPLSELFSTGSAIDYLQTKTAIIASKYPISGSFVKSIDWGNYVLANLHFDAKSTKIITQDMLANLSITKGLVYAGESIVTKGEVINQDLYQIIFSLKREHESKIGFRGSFRVLILGQALLISMLFLMLFLFLYNFRREILSDNRKIIFILLLITIMAILSSILIKRNIINIYIIPLAIVPIFIRTFYDSRLALFIHLVTVFLVGFFVPNSFEFVFIHFIAGIIAIISLTNLYRRGKLFLSISLVYISYIAVYVGIAIIQEGSILTIDPYSFLWFAINALLLLTSYQLIYLFEKIFGFLSDTTLMELSDTNQDLLRQLAEKAPGTFQHSLQVANLAEEAIFKIGGNPLLARAGALYHDIGKMNNPYYFIENQASGFNPHQGIDYEESAEIIIKHVAEGIQIAKKHNIPEQIIDFIRTHHGTNKVQYFLRLYREKYPELKDNVSLFSYKGPKPFSRETAVLMMADAVEAASRALKTITYEAINDLVENIINYQQIEEQYSDADITFKDITVVKSAFKKKLLNIYHARIEYPKAMPM